MKGILKCPFCGKKPSGKRFVSTVRGPALICDHCDADGPPALDTEIAGPGEDRYKPRAIKRWNTRAPAV